MKITYRQILPLYYWIWKIWREKRFAKFKLIVAPQQIAHLLDVGGVASDWYGRIDTAARVTTINLGITGKPAPPPGSPAIDCLEGDARKLPMRDNEFEVIYSNSVIEHVGDFKDQMAFANEVRRVGVNLWIQTPAFSCPVEPHYLGLFVHWIPLRWRWFFIRWTSFIGLTGATGEEGLRAIMNTTRLLTHREYRRLFPDCEIWVERMLWVIPKSYVAYRIENSP